MSANRNIDLVYSLIWIVLEPKKSFSRNREEQESLKEKIDYSTNQIRDPEYSIGGLKRRLNTLNLINITFLYYGVGLTALFTLITGLMYTAFGLNLELSTVIKCFGVYFNGVALAFSWRTSIAGFDYLRFKKLKTKEEIKNFKINKLAEPRLYDFAIALIPTIAFYHLMIYTVNM